MPTAALIDKELGHPTLAWIYAVLPTALIVPITILYLRLYLLPPSQSVPPFDPPAEIQDDKIMFECLSPAQAKAIRLANLHLDSDGADNDRIDRAADTEDIAREGEDEGDRSGYRLPPVAVERCYKGRCGGRWKPARTRHCSQCGTCRGGFDHHCPFFANCLTAAYMRTFLALLLYTPPTILILSSPLYKLIFHRARQAYLLSWTDQRLRTWWWDWTWSWVVAGGPVGRYAGGVILGWRELERIDAVVGEGAGLRRLNAGLLLGFGIVLALISAGLAFSTITVLLSGHLTIDKGRSSAHAQAVSAIYALKMKGLPIPDELEKKVWRFSDKRWFFVPLPGISPVDPFERRSPDSAESSHPAFESDTDLAVSAGAKSRPGSIQADREGKESLLKEDQGVLIQGGAIIPTLNHERPYDHGPRKNMQIVLGIHGWRWFLPWNAVRRGISDEHVLFSWPLAPDVERRLRDQAERLRTAQSQTSP
ncbi:hypothetical protein I317_05403 [Kwoniella heveanensis CBS 569]|nr:hypothetical protein I317_05403 [Kwoniella heveanensis CBS 569]